MVLGLGDEVIEIRYTPFGCLHQSYDQYDHTIGIRLGNALLFGAIIRVRMEGKGIKIL